jgi:hypothetical protein
MTSGTSPTRSQVAALVHENRMLGVIGRVPGLADMIQHAFADLDVA